MISYWKARSADLLLFSLFSVSQSEGLIGSWKWESLDFCSSSKMQQSPSMSKNIKGRRWLWTRTVGYTKERFPAPRSSLKENQLISKYFYSLSRHSLLWFCSNKARNLLAVELIVILYAFVQSQVCVVLHEICWHAVELQNKTNSGVWWTQSAFKTTGGKDSQRVSISLRSLLAGSLSSITLNWPQTLLKWVHYLTRWNGDAWVSIIA